MTLDVTLDFCAAMVLAIRLAPVGVFVLVGEVDADAIVDTPGEEAGTSLGTCSSSSYRPRRSCSCTGS